MNILVGINCSESDLSVVNKVKFLAINLCSKVWVIHVADPDPDFVGFEVGPQVVRDARSRSFHEKHRYTQHIAEQLRISGVDASALLLQGATVETIVQEASRLNVDMIVVGGQQHSSFRKLFCGNVTAGILHKCRCPVLFVPVGKVCDNGV